MSLFVRHLFTEVDSQFLETTILNSSRGRGDHFPPSGVYPYAKVKSLLGSVLDIVLSRLPRIKLAKLMRMMLSFLFDTDSPEHSV